MHEEYWEIKQNLTKIDEKYMKINEKLDKIKAKSMRNL